MPVGDRVFVPHARCKSHFNYFTQDNFQPNERVIALRWNKKNEEEKTIIKSITSWLLQNA